MITFTRTSPGTLDATTNTFSSGAATTITGNAIEVRPNPTRYTALGLVLTTMPTLFFSPTTYGDTPAPGDVVVWAGVSRTVKDVERIAPDGVTIAARVVIG
jgi:hypothetical protein